MDLLIQYCSDEDTPTTLYPSLRDSIRDKISIVKSSPVSKAFTAHHYSTHSTVAGRRNPTVTWESFTIIIPSQLFIDREIFTNAYKQSYKKKYKLVERIFTGRSELKKALNTLTGSTRVVKSVKKTMAISSLEQRSQEFWISKSFDHPNIMKTFEFYSNKNSIHIISEYLEGPELFELVSEAKRLDEQTASRIFYQIACGTCYLHKKGVAHRDLKPENIMFTTSSLSSIVKIIDFEFAIDAKHKILSERKGTLSYVAPEVLKKSYGIKCDIWSMGIILYVLLCKSYVVGTMPYSSTDDSEVYMEVLNKEIILNENAISVEAAHLMRNMLNRDASLRFSAGEVLRHPWVLKGAPSMPEPTSVMAILKKLKNFRPVCKFQHIILYYTASTLMSCVQTQEEAEEFRALDRNGDGRLSKGDIFKCIEENKEVNKNEVREILMSCSLSRLNYLSFSEYLTCAVNWNRVMNEEMLEKIYNSICWGGQKLSKSKLSKFLKIDVQFIWHEMQIVLKKQIKRVRSN